MKCMTPVKVKLCERNRHKRQAVQYSSMSTLSLPVRLAFGIGQLAEAVKNQGFNEESSVTR